MTILMGSGADSVCPNPTPGAHLQGALRLALLEYSLFYHISNMAELYHTLEYTIRNESQEEQAYTRLDTHGWAGVVVSTTYSELIWPGINKMSNARKCTADNQV
jgi:hypothetical protein